MCILLLKMNENIGLFFLHLKPSPNLFCRSEVHDLFRLRQTGHSPSGERLQRPQIGAAQKHKFVWTVKQARSCNVTLHITTSAIQSDLQRCIFHQSQ